MICEPKLRAIITIQVSTETQDGLGAVVESWATLASPWAEIEHLPGGENQQSDQEYARGNTRFLIRYSATLSTLTAKHRIQFGGDIYDIIDLRRMPPTRTRHVEIIGKTRRD